MVHCIPITYGLNFFQAQNPGKASNEDTDTEFIFA